MKKYKANIVLINKDCKKEIFDQCKKYVFGEVKNLLKTNIKHDIDAEIIVAKNDFEFGTEEHQVAGWTRFENNKFRIYLHPLTLEYALYDGGDKLFYFLSHEFAHLYDMFNVLHSEAIRIDVSERQKKLNKFFFIEAWDIWTEMFAYYKADSFYPKYKDSGGMTFLQLVDYYDELLKTREPIRQMLLNMKGKKRGDIVGSYHEKLREFLYYLSMYVGRYFCGKIKLKKYCDKTKSRSSFEKVDALIELLVLYFRMLLYSRYSRGYYKTMVNLGALLYKYFYKKFGIVYYRHEDKTYGVAFDTTFDNE